MAPPATNLCILIVDDDDDALSLARHLVEKADASSVIICARGGREAMTYLLRASNPMDQSTMMPSVMLLDLNMPNMSGFEVLRWVRHNRSLSRLKVIMLSASDAASDIKKAAELGAHGYLVKYPNCSCLAAMLKQAACGTDAMTAREPSDQTPVGPTTA